VVDYAPILIFLIVAAAFPAVTLVIAWGLRPSSFNEVKVEAYECGVPASGEARARYSVRFYVIAVLFVVFDLVYNPPVTRFLSEARARGARVLGGIEMFVAQAEAQFRLFTAQDPPAGVMRETLLQAIRADRPPSRPRRRSPARRPAPKRRR